MSEDLSRRKFLTISGATLLAQSIIATVPSVVQAAEKAVNTSVLPKNASTFRMVFAIFPDMTQLDFTAPYQFLKFLPNSEAIVASLDGGDVMADGLTFSNTRKLSDIADCDLILVPGGVFVTQLAQNQNFLSEIRRLAKNAKYITSVCTGSVLLGAAGLLKGKHATSHWGWLDLLPMFGAIPEQKRVVTDGNVITGGGVTAGIDFALTVMAAVAGEDFAQAMQLNLEYSPKPPFDSGSLATAPKHIVAEAKKGLEMIAGNRKAEAQKAAARLKN